MNPILVTEHLVLRRPRADDWPIVRQYLMSDRSRPVGIPADERSAWMFYAAAVGHWALCQFGMFIVLSRDTQQPIGFAGPWFPASWPEPELAWHLFDPEHEGQGLAYEACQAVLDHLFTEKGFTSIVSYIETGNQRSETLAKRLGAVHDPDALSPPDPNRNPLVAFRHRKPQ